MTEERTMSTLTLKQMARSRRPMITTGILGAALLIPVLASCGPTGQERYQHRLAMTGSPARHAVQNQRLQEIMNKLQFEPMPEPEYVPQERERRASQVAEVASSMAASAGKIPDAIKDVNLSDSDREIFLSLANKLRQQATALGEQAKRQEFDQVDRSLERMQSTCNACHSLFRTERPAPAKKG
jgi:hypothetical protein